MGVGHLLVLGLELTEPLHHADQERGPVHDRLGVLPPVVLQDLDRRRPVELRATE